MAEQQYRVVFNGALTGEWDEFVARKKLCESFKISPAKAEQLFSGNKYVLKEGVAKTLADKYLKALEKAGCRGNVEAQGKPSFEENRKIMERRVRHRRDARPGAIIPDRRVEIRRAGDKERFNELLSRGNQMPLPFRYYSRMAA